MNFKLKDYKKRFMFLTIASYSFSLIIGIIILVSLINNQLISINQDFLFIFSLVFLAGLIYGTIELLFLIKIFKDEHEEPIKIIGVITNIQFVLGNKYNEKIEKPMYKIVLDQSEKFLVYKNNIINNTIDQSVEISYLPNSHIVLSINDALNI